MELMIEVEGDGGPRALPGGGESLVALMSFAVVRGFGAQHPLIALADRLQGQHGVRMGPLTNFYDATIEDSEDVEKLELAWQDAVELEETLAGIVQAIGTDGQARALVERANANELPSQVGMLREAVEGAVVAGKRVRLSYVL